MSNNPSDIYDVLAPHYREYSEKKSAYLRAVDKYVLEHIPERAQSLLDVGAGDGIRGMSIANQKGIKYTVLCDPSLEMVNKCRELNPSDVWNVPAESLPDDSTSFDIIICLWNVLGHLADRKARITALQKMSELLSDDGLLFLDVNNRHNASTYGLLEVLRRTLIDFFQFDERRGDAHFDWKIGEQVFPAMGHLFTPSEIESIINESGLKIKERVAVHYTTGQISKSPRKGQLLYKLSKH